MESVGHLPGPRGSKTRTLCIGSPTVTADDFDTWMRDEPLFQRLSFPIRQELHRNPLFKVYQDRSERFSPKERKVVHTKNARGSMLLLWRGTKQPQERIR